MLEAIEGGKPGILNKWRIARWTGVLVLVLTPAVMMQISNGWHWTVGSFVVGALVIGGFVLLYEFAERASGCRTYRAGVAVALVTSFLTIWTTIVRDDGNGMSFFLPVMAAMLGAFVAWLRPDGMARTMLGVAIMQTLSGIAAATAPLTARSPGGPHRVLVAAGFFTLLWLISSALFRAGARAERQDADED